MTVVRAIVIGLAGILIGTTAYAMGARLAYPFELEWMEGAMVVHVERLATGQSLYVEPTLAFVPFAYPPLYFYLCAALALVIGVGFPALRIVSIAATAITGVTVASIARRSGGEAAALAACAAYAGAYGLSDAWFDLGRVDALYVMLLAITCLLAIRAATPRDWALAGAVASLAFMTKQPAVIAVAPLALYLLVIDRRAALAFIGTFVVLTLTFVLVLSAATGGWSMYYVFELPRLRFAVSSRSARMLSFWTADLVPFAVALLGGTFLAIIKREWRCLALVVGLILSAWSSRLEGGAWNNTVMPAYLGCAVLVGLGMRDDAGRPILRYGLAALQLLVVLYDPRPFVPTAPHLDGGAAFLKSVQSMRSPVWIVDHGYWSTLAGGQEAAHGWAVTDVLWADSGPVGRKLELEVRQAIERRRFSSIVVDDEGSWFFKDIAAHYRRTGEVRAGAPLSGARREPHYLYER